MVVATVHVPTMVETSVAAVVETTHLRRISGAPQGGPGDIDSYSYPVCRPQGGHWCSLDS